MKPKFFLRARLYPVSPLCIGSGESDYTDRDLLLDETGTPFLPGSALAGVCRHFLRKAGFPVEGLFGTLGTENGRTVECGSRIRFYEAYLVGGWSRGFRDGVRIGDEKTGEDTRVAAGTAKFDYEIADFSGKDAENSYFDFRISVHDVTDADKAAVGTMLSALSDGAIRLGHKTSRGFGILRPASVCAAEVRTAEELLAFDWDALAPYSWENDAAGACDFTENRTFAVTSFLTVSDSARLETRNVPDSTARDGREHEIKKFIASEPLKNAGKLPVVPGSSWAGIFRHHFRRMLSESGLMDEQEALRYIETVFGSPEHASYLVFNESVVQGSRSILQTRNAIDRFTGGAGDKKLFTNALAFGGTLTLTVSLRRGLDEKLRVLTENLVKLTFEALEDGSLSVGGFGAIGGGILRKAGDDHE